MRCGVSAYGFVVQLKHCNARC